MWDVHSRYIDAFVIYSWKVIRQYAAKRCTYKSAYEDEIFQMNQISTKGARSCSVRWINCERRQRLMGVTARLLDPIRGHHSTWRRPSSARRHLSITLRTAPLVGCVQIEPFYCFESKTLQANLYSKLPTWSSSFEKLNLWGRFNRQRIADFSLIIPQYKE